MKHFMQLSSIQKSVLVASIIADGEITKIYKNSRRKNHSYREHYGSQQEEYRVWKSSFFNGLLYLTRKSNTLRSKSSPLFTELYPYFYSVNGTKKIPFELIDQCTHFYFLAILYLDDGSLCITKRINHNTKKIYLSPTIAFYLQCYTKVELILLKQFLSEHHDLDLYLNKRKDGNGYILKLSKEIEVTNFLSQVHSHTVDCKSMQYKTNWEHRVKLESIKLKNEYPGYETLSSNSKRHRNYSDIEISAIIEMKRNQFTDKDIAAALNRTYWSIVYKLQELRKNGVL